MSALNNVINFNDNKSFDESLLVQISDDIYNQGYSIKPADFTTKIMQCFIYTSTNDASR
ncbi:hypothetical protein ACLKMH_16445 [Psychromonas sp. KJ10-10]|uniref:hypothetical protein n=1 Tax=Psychromonas sp. KJ10-10 TaxID=3391823 RepID=UPI0039B4431E